MIVLAVEGALGAFSAAICEGETVAASRSETGAVALERGLALVASVLEERSLAPERIDRLATGVGPGGFTGLRIAVSYAKALAAAWGRPLVPVSSFDILECGRRLDRALTVVVGRPGVISARYRDGAELRRASGRIADVLDELLPGGAPAPLEVVGAPEDVLHALAERAIVVRPIEPLVTPAAAAAALIASALTPPASLHEIAPDYGELPAAKPPKR